MNSISSNTVPPDTHLLLLEKRALPIKAMPDEEMKFWKAVIIANHFYPDSLKDYGASQSEVGAPMGANPLVYSPKSWGVQFHLDKWKKKFHKQKAKTSVLTTECSLILVLLNNKVVEKTFDWYLGNLKFLPQCLSFETQELGLP